jgi:hypothetical protein
VVRHWTGERRRAQSPLNGTTSAYGDFTAPASSSWNKVLQRYAIKPVQQFAYTTGKNATDSRLYGYKKLSDLVKAKIDLFMTEERQLPGSNQKVLYLRAK